MSTITIPTTSAERPRRVARLNAWFFDTFDALIDRRLGPVKAELFADLAEHRRRDRGRNRSEPALLPGWDDRHRGGALGRDARPDAGARERLGIDVQIEAAGAEQLPFVDASVDVVVSTLVLCSVEDPRAVLAEIRRVLRPGGRFLFLEHVIAPRFGLLRMCQRSARRPWSWLFDGCDTCRATEAAIRDLSWSHVAIESRRPFDPLFFPVSQQIHGTVTR